MRNASAGVRFSIAVCLSIATFLYASETALAVSANDYPELRSFIDNMVREHGFTAVELEQWFEQTRIRQDILAAVRTPKEALPWYEYRKLFVTERNAVRGRSFWQSHAHALARAERDYGVDPAIIVAVLGVETRYGRNAGKFVVLDALTTLVLEYPRRREFFRRELEEYLLLTRELNVNPLSLRGSYAGAIGVPQFIPSSYRRYAVDFDGDQRADLVHSAADAIGSVANYFKQHGWQANGPVIAEVQFDEELVTWLEKVSDKPIMPLKYLLGYGMLPLEYNNFDHGAALIRLEQENGPVYHVGYNNFYVITRYNHSRNYAMAVYELSRWIRRLYEQG